MGLCTKRVLLAFCISLGISFSAHANHGHMGHAGGHIGHGHIGHGHMGHHTGYAHYGYTPYYHGNYGNYSPIVYPWLGWGFFAGPYAYYNQYPVYTGPYWNNYYYRPRTRSIAVLSYSKETQKVGFGWGSTRDSAKAKANKACGNKDCKGIVWVYGSCAAIAKSEKTGEIGRAIDPDKDIARNKAVNDCREQGYDDCQPHAWVCAN